MFLIFMILAIANSIVSLMLAEIEVAIPFIILSILITLFFIVMMAIMF